jgi:hypothetical protein
VTAIEEIIRELVAAEVAKAKTELRDELKSESAGGWPVWMPLDVAAAYLGQTVAATRKLYEHRKVPHYQDGPGAKVWLSRSELDAYMKTNRRPAAHQAKGTRGGVE